MPITHVIAEGIGPFETISLDLSCSDGTARLGPHILAGTNGTGKTTLLKAIAWVLSRRSDGFPVAEWAHMQSGYPVSRVMLIVDVVGIYRYALASTSDVGEWWEDRLAEWVLSQVSSLGLSVEEYPLRSADLVELPSEVAPERGLVALRRDSESFTQGRARFGGPPELIGHQYNAAAYSSAKSLRFIRNPELGGNARTSVPNSLAFESTVQNEAVQAWILGLYSKRAIAKERHAAAHQYTASLDAFEKGLKQICGEDVSVDVEIEPTFQPSLHFGTKVLNFSQIPDGVRATVGWLSDFMMRADSLDWDPKVAKFRPGLLLLDEIDAYLHPSWQRRLLPALKQALPHTQIIVTSHSPFVISSCSGSVVHVLKSDSEGRAYAEKPVEAPIGESITATLKDIFGVSSRFDVQTEQELGEWTELAKMNSHRRLGARRQARYRELSKLLSSRSEELRSIVERPPKLSGSVVDALSSRSLSSHRRSKTKAG